MPVTAATTQTFQLLIRGASVIQIFTILTELSPKIVAEAFYTGEVENELRRVNCIDYTFRSDSDREMCMEMIERVRRQNIYPHLPSDCTEECRLRGKR